MHARDHPLRCSDLGLTHRGACLDIDDDRTGALEPLNSLLYTNGLAVPNLMTNGQLQLGDGRLLVGDEAELMKCGGVVVVKIWGRLKGQGYFEVGGHRG